jgi:hypothetical protein
MNRQSVEKFSTITCPHCGHSELEEMPLDCHSMLASSSMIAKGVESSCARTLGTVVFIVPLATRSVRLFRRGAVAVIE